MANEPWFKFYAQDYLLDPDVDDLPLEAQAVLVRLWCLCHKEGSCPADPRKIARKALLDIETVAKYENELSRFFERRGERLYSPRMEAEKLKSEAARSKANRRWHPNAANSNASSNASSNADCNAQSQSQIQSQNQSQIQNPPSLANTSFHSKEKKDWMQKDFDERDLREEARDRRNVASAFKELEHLQGAAFGSGVQWSEKQVVEWVCDKAGISVERYFKLEQSGKKWPQSQSLGASA